MLKVFDDRSMVRPWSKISWKDWMFLLRFKKNPDRFHQFGGYIKYLKGRWLVKSEIIKHSSRERWQPRFFCTPRAVETRCDTPWSRFALETKALFMKFPETRVSDQESSKKVPRNGRESCNFDHLDVFAGPDCTHRTFTGRSVGCWSRFAQEMKSFLWTCQKPDFQTRKIPRKFRETGGKVAILTILMFLQDSNVPTGRSPALCWLPTKIRTGNETHSRAIWRNQIFKPGKFEEILSGKGLGKLQFRPYWYDYRIRLRFVTLGVRIHVRQQSEGSQLDLQSFYRNKILQS